MRLITSFCIIAFLSCSQASFLFPLKNDADAKEVDRVATADWVEKFYDQCGRTRNVGEDETNPELGTYRGHEVTKTCVGDRDNCIEERNCYFAVAIEETVTYRAQYIISTPPSGSLSTSTQIFDRFDRRIEQVQVSLLDTCHVSPIHYDKAENADNTEKFIGLAFGVFNENSRTLNCSAANFHKLYDIDNIRAYFFVKDFTKCKLRTDTPVHPVISKVDPVSPRIEHDPIQNTVVITPNTWASLCGDITATLSKEVSETDPDFLRNLLLMYYGTPGYAQVDPTKPTRFSYADAAFVDTRGHLRLHPKGEERAPPKPEENGSSAFNPTALSSLLVIVPFFRQFV